MCIFSDVGRPKIIDAGSKITVHPKIIIVTVSLTGLLELLGYSIDRCKVKKGWMMLHGLSSRRTWCKLPCYFGHVLAFNIPGCLLAFLVGTYQQQNRLSGGDTCKYLISQLGTESEASFLLVATNERSRPC